jgi:hypothetical protein
MNRLEVKTSNPQLVSLILLGVIIVPLAAATVYSGVRRGFSPAPFLIGLLMLVLYGAVLRLVWRAHRRSVRLFTEDGLVRNDGQRLPWTDLSHVVDQMHRRRQMAGDFLWRTEIHFNDGSSAWLLPLKVANFQAVADYVARLPCEHRRVRV